MKCSDFLSVLYDYIDGETDRQTEKQIKEHLSECEACNKAYQEAKALKDAVRKTGDIPVPDTMAEDALQAIQNEIEEGKVRFRLPAFLSSWPLYVSLAACLVLFFVLKDNQQRQMESYVYSPESGAVAVTESTAHTANARIVTDGDGKAAKEAIVSPYSPISSLVKRTITFTASDKAAEATFNAAKGGGTDAVIRVLTEKGFAFSVETSVSKDCTAEYNALIEECTALYIRIAEGDANAEKDLTQKEAQLSALKTSCSKPDLKLVIQ